MDRRRFLTGVGLFTIGGATGAGVVDGVAPGSGAPSEGPTARTAAPGGTGAFAATATFRTAPSAKVVALTIDDGPTREWTPRLLDILRRRNAHATFYRVGGRARAPPRRV
jgi:peptidoglycan/xylan/chitin deacetylase (PgdA/CDA1 family)